MKAEDFTAWVNLQGFSDRAAARALGASRDTVARWKAKGAPVYIGYACAAIAFGLPPWKHIAHE